MPDPFLDALATVRQAPAGTDPGGGDPFAAALADVRQVTPVDTRSRFARVVDTLSEPLLPQIAAGAHALADRIAAPRLGDAELNEHLPGVGTLSAMIRGGVGGAVQGVGDVAASFSSPLGVAATLSGVGAERAGAAGLIQGARALRGVEAATGAAFAERGVEQAASAPTWEQKAIGVAQAAGGLLGMRAGVKGFRQPAAPSAARPVVGALPATSFEVTPEGVAGRPGDVLPMVQAPDGSFVRGVPADYAQREVRGLLPAGPGFIADESGQVATLAQAQGDPFAAALESVRGRRLPTGPDPSGVQSVRAAPLSYTAESGRVEPRTFSGDVEAAPAAQVELSPTEDYALTWIRQDMDALPFVRRTFNETTGRGSDFDVVPGAAGARIFRAIVGEEGREISGASRADVLRAIDNLRDGKLTKTGDLVLNVARDLAEGRPRVQQLMDTPPPEVPQGPGVRDVDPADAVGGREPGEEGAIDPTLVSRVGLGAAGAGYGYATGDTTEDRLKRAALFGGAGVLLPSLLKSSPETVGVIRGRLRVPDDARAPVPPADQIPTGRLRSNSALTPDVQDAADAILERHGGFVAQRRGVQSVARTEGLADRVEVPTDRPLRAGTALNAERLRAYQNATATLIDKQQRLQQAVDRGQATPAQQLELEQAKSEAAVLTASFRGAAAEAGRALHILRYQARILASGDPEAIREAVTASDRGIAGHLRSYFYANILSGIGTHERNILGNLGNATFSLAAHPFATAADVVRSAVTGQARGTYLGELPERVAGTVAALPRAFANVLNTLKTGLPRQEVATFDRPMHAELRGGGANPFNWPGRALEAADDFFSTLAQQQTLYGSAFAAAKREGLSGDALLRRVADLKANPSDAMLQEATSQREHLLFRERPGAVAQAVLAAKRHLPMLDYVIPFVRVPANIIRQGFEASPAGFGMSAARQGGRLGADAMGRAALGSMVLAPLAYWAAAGKVTGDAPHDPAKRAAFYESGRQPNSVQIGNTWYSYQSLQPINVPLSLIANGFQVWRESKADPSHSADQIATDVIGRTAGSLLNQSFLSGISALVDALSDPDRYGRAFVQQLGTGMVPFSGALRTVTQATDPYVRQPQSIAEGVQAIVPHLSTQLPPRLTRFGEPVRRGSGPFNVFKPSDAVSDPVADVLAEADIHLRPAQGAKDVALAPGVRVPLGRDERFQVGQNEGRAVRTVLEAVIQTPNYQRADPVTRRLLLERAISEARGAVHQGVRAAIASRLRAAGGR